MDLFEAIARRYSYRGAFKEGSIPREDLKKIVQAGLDAPSGTNAQTTTFVIVDEPELLRKIGCMHKNSLALQQARALIACLIDRQPAAVYDQYSFQVEDCAAAVENMLLAITALGYASVWIDGWLRREQHAEAIAQLLGIPNNKLVRIVLPLGVPVSAGPRQTKKTLDERAWFNRFKAG